MKRPLSLLEVAIGLALTAILLTALFSSFRQMIQTNVKVQHARDSLHWTYVAQLRLMQVFETLAEGKKEFYTEDGVLHFSYDNGVDLDPKFCNRLSAELKCENQKFFLLSEKKREEIFLTGVKEITFRFYDPKKRKWVKEWNAPFLPPCLKIEIEDQTFHFFLPKANRTARFS